MAGALTFCCRTYQDFNQGQARRRGLAFAARTG